MEGTHTIMRFQRLTAISLTALLSLAACSSSNSDSTIATTDPATTVTDTSGAAGADDAATSTTTDGESTEATVTTMAEVSTSLDENYAEWCKRAADVTTKWNANVALSPTDASESQAAFVAVIDALVVAQDGAPDAAVGPIASLIDAMSSSGYVMGENSWDPGMLNSEDLAVLTASADAASVARRELDRVGLLTCATSVTAMPAGGDAVAEAPTSSDLVMAEG